MDHLIWYSVCLSLRSQMYLDSSVSFSFCLWRNVFLWLWNSIILCFANHKIKIWWLLRIGYYFGRINIKFGRINNKYFRCLAFIVKRAVVTVSTVAKILFCLILFGCNVLVLGIYNFCHIVHTTIANVYIVFIKYFMIFIIFSEGFL